MKKPMGMIAIAVALAGAIVQGSARARSAADSPGPEMESLKYLNYPRAATIREYFKYPGKPRQPMTNSKAAKQ